MAFIANKNFSPKSMSKREIDLGDDEGVWRTVGGRRIFIREGQSLENAMKESGKFKLTKSAQQRVEEETEKVKKNMSNDLKSFKKEEIDLEKVRVRGGLTKEEAKECADVAEKIYEEGAKYEPQISKDLVEISKQNGATMYGLDFRIKQPNSLAGKIGDDAKKDDITFAKAGSNIKDAVRYTTILDDKNFAKNYNKIKQELENKGYKELRAKNFYQLYKSGDMPQKAIQCVYQNKDGYKFELQYHTINSQGAKEVNHPLYEEWRNDGTSKERKLELENKMRKNGAWVKDPEGVYEIKHY